MSGGACRTFSTGFAKRTQTSSACKNSRRRTLSFRRRQSRKRDMRLFWRRQKTWNGVAILSKWKPIKTLSKLPGDPTDTQSRYIEAAVNGIIATPRRRSSPAPLPARVRPSQRPVCGAEVPHETRSSDAERHLRWSGMGLCDCRGHRKSGPSGFWRRHAEAELNSDPNSGSIHEHALSRLIGLEAPLLLLG